MVTIGLILDEYGSKSIGGVSTWTNHFIKMINDYSEFDVTLFYCYEKKDDVTSLAKSNVILINKNTLQGIKNQINNLDIVINCLWSTNKVIRYIKNKKPIITVIHSLIFLEVITNNTRFINNFQEETFTLSDHLVFVSKSDQQYFIKQYPNIKVPTSFIYNTYVPEHFNRPYKNLDTIGYIGRYVPRKRPELAILGLENINRLDVPCLMMGDHSNIFWANLNEKFNNLQLVSQSFNSNNKNKFFDKVGIGSFTSIYEPFGYSLLEFIDRGIPVIVAYIDGPKEIIKDFEEFVYPYQVFKNYKNDIESYSKVLKHVLSLSPQERENNAQNAKKILEKFKPGVIFKEWKNLILSIL